MCLCRLAIQFTAKMASAQVDECQPSVRTKKGLFDNPWPEWKFPSKKGLAKFVLVEKNYSKVPSSKQELDQTLPVVRPDLKRLVEPPEQGLRAVWIGHASVLVQMCGVSILTDPIFSARCSPSQLFGPKRYRDPPLTVDELPRIDAVVISHNHYDHLDYGSVKDLNARFGSDLHWFVPLGLRAWMEASGCRSVSELDWWQEATLPGHDDVEFACVPAQHWCKRTALDTNRALWCGWSIISPKAKFYFAGDTGYCPAFTQIGRKYGPFDLAAIPVGAYEPRWFMKCQHVNPEDAVQVHEDVRAKKSLAIHWGTFNLSYEFYLDPPKKVTEAMQAKGLKPDDFFALKHGEIWESFNTTSEESSTTAASPAQSSGL